MSVDIERKLIFKYESDPIEGHEDLCPAVRLEIFGQDDGDVMISLSEGATLTVLLLDTAAQNAIADFAAEWAAGQKTP